MMDQPLPALLRPASPNWRVLAPNLLLFQAGWFAAVLGAANGMPWLGILVIAGSLAFHLYRASEPAREARLVVVVLLVGLMFESVLAASGWVAYADHAASTPPAWMVALWANFAVTLNIALRSLRTRAGLLAALGLVGGPLAYWGGAGLDALSWQDPGPAFVYIALGWAFLMPLLGRLALRLDGYRHGI